MILHLLRMRRNVNHNVFNDRKNVSATPGPDSTIVSRKGRRNASRGQCGRRALGAPRVPSGRSGGCHMGGASTKQHMIEHKGSGVELRTLDY